MNTSQLNVNYSLHDKDLSQGNDGTSINDPLDSVDSTEDLMQAKLRLRRDESFLENILDQNQ